MVRSGRAVAAARVDSWRGLGASGAAGWGTVAAAPPPFDEASGDEPGDSDADIEMDPSDMTLPDSDDPDTETLDWVLQGTAAADDVGTSNEQSC